MDIEDGSDDEDFTTDTDNEPDEWSDVKASPMVTNAEVRIYYLTQLQNDLGNEQ